MKEGSLSLGQLTSREAVRGAAAVCDELGPQVFLERYGYAPARVYLLELDGKHYDSKAIAGVAHGIQYPDLGPLTANEFNGGAAGAAGRLQRLGFTVVTPAQVTPPRVGIEYPDRTAIYERYGGDRVGGLCGSPARSSSTRFRMRRGRTPTNRPAPLARSSTAVRGVPATSD